MFKDIKIKIKLTLNQLISNTFYLGYSKFSRNIKFNYFLLGESNFNDLINLNITYILIKKYLSFLINIFSLESQVWVVNNNFSIFSKIDIFYNLLRLFPVSNNQIYFPQGRFVIGSFTNCKNISIYRKWNFPHVVFFPSILNNYYIINECTTVGIPTFGICDTIENPHNLMFVIPGNSKSLRPLVLMYLLLIRSFLYSKIYKSSKFLAQIIEKILKKKFDILKKMNYSTIESNLQKNDCKSFIKYFLNDGNVNKNPYSIFFSKINKGTELFILLKKII